MQIKFQGQYDKDTFFKAVRIANQPVRNRNGLLYFMLIVAVGALSVLIRRLIETGDWQSNMLFIVAAIIMGGLAIYSLTRPYFTARNLWANPGVQRPLKGQVTNQGITYQLAEGRNEIPWSQFNRLRKRPGLVALVRKDGLMVAFPRRFFKKSNDWERFQKLVDQKVISTDRAFRRRPRLPRKRG